MGQIKNTALFSKVRRRPLRWGNRGIRQLLLLSLVVVVCLCTRTSLAHAASASWTNSSGGNWSDVGSWTAGGPPNSPTDNATLPDLGTPLIIVVNGTFSVNTLTFSNALPDDYNLSGGTLNVYGTVSVATDDNSSIASNLVLENTVGISLAANADLRIYNNITGTGGLTISGVASNVLQLHGADTYNGTTTINSGTVQGSGTNNLSPNSDFVLANSAGAVLVGGGQTIGSLAGGALSYVPLMGANLTLGDSQSTTYAGYISDCAPDIGCSTGGGIVKQGTGTFTLTNSNSYTGYTTLNGGQITLGNNNAISTGQLVMANGTTLGLNNGIVAPNAISINNSCTGSFFVDSGNTGTLSGNIATTSGSLVKTGLGTLVLNGTNTYSGTTTVSQGTLTIDGPVSGTTIPALSSGAVTVAQNATLHIALATAGSYTIPNTINLGGTLDLDPAGGFSTINFSSPLILTNNGEVTLTNVNATLSSLVTNGFSLCVTSGSNGTLSLSGQTISTCGVTPTSSSAGVTSVSSPSTGYGKPVSSAAEYVLIVAMVSSVVSICVGLLKLYKPQKYE